MNDRWRRRLRAPLAEAGTSDGADPAAQLETLRAWFTRCDATQRHLRDP